MCLLKNILRFVAVNVIKYEHVLNHKQLLKKKRSFWFSNTTFPLVDSRFFRLRYLNMGRSHTKIQ